MDAVCRRCKRPLNEHEIHFSWSPPLDVGHEADFGVDGMTGWYCPRREPEATS